MLFARSSASTRASPPPREEVLKNACIYTSSTKTETSVETLLQEQLAAEQESFVALVDQVDELKRKT